MEEGVEGGDELHGEGLLPAVVSRLDDEGSQSPPWTAPVRALRLHPCCPLLEAATHTTMFISYQIPAAMGVSQHQQISASPAAQLVPHRTNST